MSKWLRIDMIVDSISVTHKFDKAFLKFLNTSDVERGKIINVNIVSVKELKGQAKKTIKKGDILFSEIRPKNGRYAYIDIENTDDYVVSTKLMVLRNKNVNVDNKYFYYYLTNENMLNILQNRAESRICSFPQITFDLLSEFSIRIPSLTEQKNIVNVLLTLDKKIELNTKIIKELEEMAKELYDYWFVQFDFPDANGKPYRSSGGKMVYNSTLKREIPEGWGVKTLATIANITMGQSPAGQSYNDIGDGTIFYQGSTDFGQKFPIVRQYSNQPTRFAKAGDILLSVRAPVGAINFAKFDCCIGRGLAALNSKIDCMSYLYQILSNLKVIFDRRNVEGTTFGSITKEDLFTQPTLIPSRILLKQFGNITENYLKKQFICSDEIDKLIALRDWLLPMLMNGQVTVANAEINPETRIIPIDVHILGGHIVNRLYKTKGMGRTKLQKSLHLIEYYCQLPLNSEFIRNTAGPDDQEMMKYIDRKFYQYGHVKVVKTKVKGKSHYDYIPTNKISEIEQAFEHYSEEKKRQIDELLEKLKIMDLNRAEIVSTLYAVWNNRIIKEQDITDELLLTDFYAWSSHKSDFPGKLVMNGLEYMRQVGIIPTGWGKYIDRKV